METSSSVDRVADDGFSRNDESKENTATKGDDSDKSDSEGCQKDVKKHRIVYDKKFLMECYNLPWSKRKPADFPLPNLGCTLSSIKDTGNSPFAAPPPYVPPKRKEEGARREREPDDNISLRPHSGNFSGGCGPTVPIGYRDRDRDRERERDREGASAGLQQIIDEHFRDNGRNNNHRFASNKRFEQLDRIRGDRPLDRDLRDTRDRDRDLRDTRDRDRDLRDTRDRDRDLRDTRDRDRDLRDTRDRDRDRDRNLRGDRIHFSHRRITNPHGWGEVPERDSEWNRRRNRNGSGGSYNDNKNRRGYFDGKERSNYHEREEEQEPEWFSGGPSSQHETIELRGFTDDDRRDRERGKPKPGTSEDSNTYNHTTNGSAKSASPVPDEARGSQEEAEGAAAMDLSLEKILKMDHIPGILPNGLLEDEDQPSGRSKFSNIFQRNLASNAPKEEKKGKEILDKLIEARAAARTGANSTEETEGKKEIAAELGNALRNMLLKPSQSKVDKEEKRATEPTPSAAKSQPKKKTEKQGGGVNALQALLSKMIETPSKTESGRSSAEIGEPLAIGQPVGVAEPPNTAMGSTLSQILSIGMHNMAASRPQAPSQQQFSHPQHPQEINRSVSMPIGNGNFRPPHMPIPHPVQVNPFQVFENIIRQQHPPSAPRETISPTEVMSILPPEIQYLVHNVDPCEMFWTQQDANSLIRALNTGELTFRKLIHDLLSPQCNRKPFLASIVQMILAGAVIVPSLHLLGHPLKFIKTYPEPQPAHQMHNHFSHQHEVSARQVDDADREVVRRSGTPVSSMAFTPTAVMRKMTAESPKPSTSSANAVGSPSTPHGIPHLNNPGQNDFSFIVSQLTGQPPARPHVSPQQMHAAQFQPIHPQGPMMVSHQHTQGPPQMIIHPNFGMGSPHSMMNLPHPHHEMPQMPNSIRYIPVQVLPNTDSQPKV